MQEKSAKSGAFKRVEVKNYGLLFFCMLRFGALHPEISGIRERREKERKPEKRETRKKGETKRREKKKTKKNRPREEREGKKKGRQKHRKRKGELKI